MVKAMLMVVIMILAIMLSSQFVKWLRGGLGLLVGIVALRALEARYLPPLPSCATLPGRFYSFVLFS